MITLSHLAWACFILACLLFTAYILYFLADDRPRREPGRHQAHIIPGYDDEPGNSGDDVELPESRFRAEVGRDKSDTGWTAADLVNLADGDPECVLHSHAHWAKCDEPDCHGCAPGGDHGEKPPARGLLQLTEQEGGQSNERLAELTAPLNVTGLTASAPDAPQASPVTPNLHDPESPTAGAPADRVVEFHRAHAIETAPVQYWAGQYRDGLNARTNCWPMGDGELDASAWTKRDSVFLDIQLARDATDAGFDQLLREIRNFADYASSGLMPRWEGAA